MQLTEKTLSSEKIYQGKVVTLCRDKARLPDGREAVREVIRHPGGVGIVAVDGQDNLLMVRQFRYPFGAPLLEIPAGKLEYGEDAAQCGRRELEEETGHTADSYVPLGKLLPTPAYDDEVIHLYYASALTQTHQHLDDGEFLSVERIPFERAVEMILSGEIRDAKTQIGILKAKILRERGQL